MPLGKKYNFIENEKMWNITWQDECVYAYDHNSSAERFVIDTPPPTISGSLHMGHVFSYCHADFIARFQRMSGKNVFYPIGFDDNGLPTEKLVEKENKIRTFDVTRSKFSNMCAEISEKFREDFYNLFTRLGFSFDWSLSYNTANKHCMHISQASFIELYNKNIAYLKYSPCAWDCLDRTAVAQAEIVETQTDSFMHEIFFTLLSPEGKNLGHVVIATTRPELIHACLAVFFHPDDKRYSRFNNAKNCFSVVTPCGICVPLIANDEVNIDKGTGLVMFCTFGDDLDLNWYNSPHKIANANLIFKLHPNALDKHGHILQVKLDDNDYLADFAFDVDSSSIDLSNFWKVVDKELFFKYTKASKDFYVKKARDNIVGFLQDNRFLSKTEQITHTVRCSERSGALLEFVSSRQWYIDILSNSDKLLSMAKKCEWHPVTMYSRIEQWISGLKANWCISRQRYNGIPFPVWYIDLAAHGKFNDNCVIFIASVVELPINPMERPPKEMQLLHKLDDDSNGFLVKCINDYIAPCNMFNLVGDIVVKNGETLFKNGDIFNIYPETMVMDTWATSALTPQINAGGLNAIDAQDGKFFNNVFPANLRSQAHEIIRTWAFYTIAKSFFHNNIAPWNKIMISGWCLADDRSKMSKSKGNTIDPNVLLMNNSADVIRYWASTTKLGADTSISDDTMYSGHRLVNKLWNAARFVSLHVDAFSAKSIDEDIESKAINSVIDLWVLHKLSLLNNKYKKCFNDLDYCTARQAVEDFFWSEFCNNYLEFIKVRIYADQQSTPMEERYSAVNTVCHCFRAILIFFAPFLPYITEAIYRSLFIATGSIHITNNKIFHNDSLNIPSDAIRIGEGCVSVLSGVRRIKSERNISIKKSCKLFLAINNNSDFVDDISNIADLRNAINADSISWGEMPNDNYDVVGDYKFSLLTN
ncbi:Valine--tRNA ligase [Candidatus Xenohaliotis californiensis]|uniref:valine--tRNA ligase n=1 Tax=Candidatus Xenohaliotis californiensis TaxID=84677 RepID=A0ABM9N9G8_9RICK|nr:Valine--tRNA ligase [Candidatus Xenohaliotis californiensis]